MKKVHLILLTAGALLLASCAQSTTAPSQMRSSSSGARPRFDDSDCPYGYSPAYDEDGNPICVPDSNSPTGARSATRRP